MNSPSAVQSLSHSWFRYGYPQDLSHLSPYLKRLRVRYHGCSNHKWGSTWKKWAVTTKTKSLHWDWAHILCGKILTISPPPPQRWPWWPQLLHLYSTPVILVFAAAAALAWNFGPWSQYSCQIGSGCAGKQIAPWTVPCVWANLVTTDYGKMKSIIHGDRWYTEKYHDTKDIHTRCTVICGNKYHSDKVPATALPR